MLELKESSVAEGVAVVVAKGRVEIRTQSEQIEATVKRLIGAGARTIIFDISGVTHMDSTGIGRFIASMSHAMPVGAKIYMACAAPAIRDVFRVTRLDSVFRFFDTVEEAVKAA